MRPLLFRGAEDTAAQVFGRNEIESLQVRFMELNEWLEEGVMPFGPILSREAPHRELA